MSRETQTPQIPQVTEENLLEVVRSLKEIMEVREGRRGDELDELVTYRDLVSLGIVKKLATGGYGDNTGVTDAPVIVPTGDSNVPPAPTNLSAKATYNVIALTWTVPSYRNHGVTEIWRAKVDDLTKAAKIGDTAGVHFSDPIADSGTYWYWVRNISMAAVAGPYNSQSGTSATAMASVADMLKDIAADIESSALMRDLRSRVEGLEDGTFVPKYINDVVIRADEIARESKTLVSRSNSSLAYVQQAMETVSGMRAKYTVKLGVGNHVAGFGMAVEPNSAGTTTSAFIIAANKFGVAPPSIVQATAPAANLFPGFVWVDSSVTPNVTKYWTGPGGVPAAPPLPAIAANTWTTDQRAASAPFTIYTTPTTLPSGRVVGPGVYMNNAYIAELQVDKLAAGALSVGQYIQSQGYIPSSAGWKIGADGFAELSGVTVRGTMYATAGYMRGVEIQKADGTVILSSGSTLQSQIQAMPNLVRGTSLWSVSSPNFHHASSPITEDGTTLVITSGNATPFSSPAMALSGGTYTVSFRASATQARVLHVDLYPDTLPQSDVVLTPGWAFYQFTWTSSHADMGSCVLRFFADATAGQIEIGDIKLEAGPYRTLWVPHRLDQVGVNNKIASSNASTYIADLAVDTLQIAGNAVTVPLTDRRSTSIVGNNTSQQLASATITLDNPGWVYALFSASQFYGSGAKYSWTSLQIASSPAVVLGGLSVTTNIVVADAVYLGAGTHAVEVTWTGENSGVSVGDRVLYVQGVMR